MNLFLGILLGALCGFVVLLCCFLVEEWTPKIVAIYVVAYAITIFSPTLIGMTICTNDEIAYVSSYQVQKATIESSLTSPNITGWERTELIKKAVELNGEFTYRKTQYSFSYNLYWDNTIYDGVEPISFD